MPSHAAIGSTRGRRNTMPARRTTQHLKRTPAQRPAQLALDFSEGKRLRDAGMEMALYTNAAVPWALRAERWLAARAEPFTADHLIAAVGLPNGEKAGSNGNNAVGC